MIHLSLVQCQVFTVFFCLFNEIFTLRASSLAADFILCSLKTFRMLGEPFLKITRKSGFLEVKCLFENLSTAVYIQCFTFITTYELEIWWAAKLKNLDPFPPT
ncbi:hypothetical protein AMECASPLE_023580 [Ameca splendens]|uniref:Secreted protein n=1 Tax=Ameca splendens TaxID=208324 RepID=A0ABV0Y470_9TELE